jgi:hypothetical protein
LTPRGIASPHWKGKGRSRYPDLPVHLLDSYQQAMSDPDLLSLKSEISVVDARINDLMGKVTTEGGGGFVLKAEQILDAFIEAQVRGDVEGMKLYLSKLDGHIRQGKADWGMWGEITDLFKLRATLTANERKRLVDAQLMIDARQAMALLAAITAIIRENVQDRTTLSAIAGGIARLTNYQLETTE